MKTALHRLALSLIAASFLPACSMGFHRDWRAAAKSSAGTGVEGAWEGTWKSEATGHHGSLKCIVGPAKNAQGDRDFRYWASWKHLLSGTFDAVHQVTPQGKAAWKFTGQHQMPDWAGGLYTYDGTVIGDHFHADYKAAKDHGTYDLTRTKK